MSNLKAPEPAPCSGVGGVKALQELEKPPKVVWFGARREQDSRSPGLRGLGPLL